MYVEQVVIALRALRHDVPQLTLILLVDIGDVQLATHVDGGSYVSCRGVVQRLVGLAVDDLEVFAHLLHDPVLTLIAEVVAHLHHVVAIQVDGLLRLGVDEVIVILLRLERRCGCGRLLVGEGLQQEVAMLGDKRLQVLDILFV